MKLRIRKNALRLRLAKREVDHVAEHGQLEETVAFGPAPTPRLTYGLLVDDAAPRVAARFEAGAMTIVVPRSVLAAWVADSAQVGFEGTQPIAEDEVLSILVEKDWSCLVPRKGEDDGDAFPHPKAALERR